MEKGGENKSGKNESIGGVFRDAPQEALQPGLNGAKRRGGIPMAQGNRRSLG